MHVLSMISLVSAAFIGTSISGTPGNVTAVSNSSSQSQNCNIQQIYLETPEDLQKLCDKLGISFENFKPCLKPVLPDNTPDTDVPGTPDTDAPNTDVPENPDTPDTEVPGTPDTDVPDTPDTDVPDTPDTDAPGLPDTDVPEHKPEHKPEDNGTTDSSYAAQVVSLVNEERAKEGLSPLSADSNVTTAALTRAKEIKTSFSHTRPNGTSFSTALKEQGVSYRGSGENIAWGQKTPQEVVTAWMNSPGHRANILNKNFTTIGVGYYTENSVAYWTQLFTY